MSECVAGRSDDDTQPGGCIGRRCECLWQCQSVGLPPWLPNALLDCAPIAVSKTLSQPRQCPMLPPPPPIPLSLSPSQLCIGEAGDPPRQRRPMLPPPPTLPPLLPLPTTQLCIGEPEVRQVTLPANGARLIIASDGLWDAVQHKTIISNVRGRGVLPRKRCG